MVAGSVLVLLMTLLYFGSIADPGSHLRGLPVAVVDEDTGANTPAGHVDVGQRVVAGLTGAQAVTSRLALDTMTLAAAQARVNKGAAYATAVIPSGFTASLLAVAGNPVSTGQAGVAGHRALDEQPGRDARSKPGHRRHAARGRCPVPTARPAATQIQRPDDRYQSGAQRSAGRPGDLVGGGLSAAAIAFGARFERLLCRADSPCYADFSVAPS